MHFHSRIYIRVPRARLLYSSIYPNCVVEMWPSKSGEYSRKCSNNRWCNNHDTSKAPLLPQNSLSLGKKVRRHFLTNTFVCSKSVFVILLWHLVTELSYSLFLNPLIYMQYTNLETSLGIAGLLAVAYLFSPMAGFLADVKFSHFKVLKCSTYITLASTFFFLTVGSLMIYSIHITGYYFIVLITLLGLAMLLCGIGHMMFIANIIQFGTSQLREAPSQNSVIFLCWYFWVSEISNLISFSTHLSGHRSYIHFPHKSYGFDKLNTSITVAILCLSVVSSAFILLLLHKRQTWFRTDTISVNPYKLVCKVIKFACLNKRPVYRSAFTYCEDELPSRMDHGKMKYGGPFSTEQVEDVKVFLRILKVLFSFGPTFLMDVATTTSILKHAPLKTTLYNISESLTVEFLDYGILSPLFTVVCIPVYLSIIRPFFSRCLPNILKRMGLVIVLLCISLLLFVAFDIANYKQDPFYPCIANTSYVFDKKHFPSDTYLFVVQNTLSSLYNMLLYIAAWEFICSQSPQSMKGLLFGLFFAIKGFYQTLAIALILPFDSVRSSHIFGCRYGYYILNLCVGLVSLLIYTVVARRYKYRKRDDICNIYQYAEEYYSNIQ